MMRFPIPEPEWILDKSETGPLFWRRDSSQSYNRVKFRYDVEVKEFQRGPHELDDHHLDEGSDILTMSLICIICIGITIVLPLYILTGKY